MKILFDLQACQTGSKYRGIGRYSMSLAKAIMEAGAKHDFHVLVNGSDTDLVLDLRHEFENLVANDKFHLFFPVGLIAYNKPETTWRRAASARIREELINKICPDLVFVLSFFEGYSDEAIVTGPSKDRRFLTVSVVYDFIPLMMPDWYLANVEYRTWFMEKVEAIKTMDGLVAISESSGDEAHKVTGLSASLIGKAVAAVSDKFSPDEDLNHRLMILSRHNIPENFVLYAPGGFDERKNFLALFSAWRQLPLNIQDTYKLVIASSKANIHAVMAHMAAAKLHVSSVIFTGYIPDEDLIALYSSCKVFVFPSLYEGFGLPVLEAMACGAPVIGSASTSIPEVIGRADALFDPTDPTAIASLIERVIVDEAFRNELKAFGLARSKMFTWKAAGDSALAHLEKLYSLRQARTVKAPPLASFEDFESDVAEIALENSKLQRDDLRLCAVSMAMLIDRPGKKCLFVDITNYSMQDLKTGVQRVVRSILNHLPTIVSEDYEIVPVVGAAGGNGRYVRAERVERETPEVAKSKKGEGMQLPVDPRRGDIFLGLDLTFNLFPEIASTLTHYKALGVRLFFLVHDLIPVLYPHFCANKVVVEKFEIWLRTITRYADSLICVSQSTVKDLKNWLVTNPPKRNTPLPLHYSHNGADLNVSVTEESISTKARNILTKFDGRDTFLMVGTIEPRKGHVFVIEAFTELWTKSLNANLVIVGNPGWKIKAIEKRILKHSEYNRRLFWFQNTSDSILDAIYANSTALIAASEAEGFGLPIIEASMKGLHIIARDIPVFREVAENGAFYFPGDDPKSLVASMIEWMRLRDSSTLPDPKLIKSLTWKESARNLLNIIMKN